MRKLHIAAQARHNSGFWGEDSEDPLFRTTAWTIVDARAGWDIRHLYSVRLWSEPVRYLRQVLGYAGPRDDPEAEVGLTDPREDRVGLQARF